MTDYVISYDICAFMLMCIFAAYYFSCKRFQSKSNKAFGRLIFLVLLSISFDILGVITLKYRMVLPNWLVYFTNIAYFEVTGAMAIYYCMYTLIQTGSSFSRKDYTGFGVFLIPFIAFASLMVTTPWTHLAFYIDENHNYVHGPLMNLMLVVVVLYLGFSMFRITFYHDNVTFKKRIPYYTFTLCMTISIIIQAFSKVYLMYGIAEAIGIIVLYISGHNPNDLLDNLTDMFNRKALIIRLHDMDEKHDSCSIIGFGFRDYLPSDGRSQDINRGHLLEQISRFLTSSFDSEQCYYVDNSSFVILCPEGQEQAIKTVQKLRKRFKESWRYKGGEAKIRIGVAEARFPKDFSSPSELINLIQSCISFSYMQGSTVVRAEDLQDLRDSKIKELEFQQKELEEKFIESESKMIEAVNADRSKTMFLAQMSHEIRTPMTAILGMTELLMRDTNDPKVIEHANAIMSSGKTLIGIINDILDFSKIESGKFELICEEYDIKSSIMDVLNGIEQRVSDKRLDFKLYFDPNIPAKMYGDPIRIRQIISNLMTNACKYTEKGCVSLSIREISRQGDTVVTEIKVSDTGIGISKENIPKLFDGFTRFDTEKNKAIEGTGLGLAICKQLVDTMQGNLVVDSVYGEGTTFTVTLPQKVIDPSSSVKIEDADKLSFLAFYKTENERESFVTTMRDFNIDIVLASTAEEFNKALNDNPDKFSHIFITYGEYEHRAAAGDALLNDPRLVIAIYYRQYMVNLNGYKVIHFPINSIFLSTLLSGGTVYENSLGDIPSNNYIAPEVNLLAVDDNLVNLRIFSGLLECHKMNIDTVDSGDKCITCAQNKKYDMIFLDHMMPRKDGIETLHEMLQDDKNINKDTPVIAFTANAISGMREMFIENGFSDFLSKPIDITKMENILRLYLPADKFIPINEVMSFVEPDEEPVTDSASDNSSAASGPSDGSFVVEGINMENALYYTGGSYDTLRAVLEVFVEDGRKKLPLLVQYVENKDLENYRIEIHAVKSLCKGIGADELSEKARLLEMSAKEGNTEYIAENWKEVYDEYAKLIDNVNDSISSVKVNNAIVADDVRNGPEDRLLDINEELTCAVALIHEFETDLASKIVEDLTLRITDESTRSKILDVRQKLSVFDYDGAVSIITEVLNEN